MLIRRINMRRSVPAAVQTAQVEKLTAEKDAAQSTFSEKQSELEAMQTGLAKAKEAMHQANAKATELENAANQARDAEAQRSSKMQSSLD
jgi:chromosome segregation ATPase